MSLTQETAVADVSAAPRDVPEPAVALARGRLSRLARGAVLALADAAGLLAAATLAYLLWALPVREQAASLYLSLLPLLGIFTLAYAQAGLYPGFGLGPVETLRRLSTRTAFGFLLLTSISFAVKLPYLFSRVTFGLAFLFSLLLVPLLRLGVVRLASRLAWWSEPLVVVGLPDTLENLRQRLPEIARMGYACVGFLEAGGGAGDARPLPAAALPRLGGLDQAEALARQGVRVALIETGGERPQMATLDHLHRHFRHLVMIRRYEALPVEGVQVRNLGGLLGIEYTNNSLLRRNRLLKRLLDLSLGSLALVLALPAIALSALAVKLLSWGPAFYHQVRAGLDGRPIRVWKIRTMYPDAEERLQQVLATDPERRREWETGYKLADDPRILPWVGRLLRRFSFDELPQLWCVVRGDMSLVGPRPFPEYHLARFSEEFRQLRHRVRPGITGMWQVSVRSAGGLEEQQALDSYYIRNWSLWLDLYLLSRTLGAVVSGRGAY